MNSILLTIISMAVGAIITWIVAKYYYEKASNDLKEEAQKLRTLNTLILRALESAGIASFNKDQGGEIKGLIIKLSSNLNSKSRTSDIELKIQ
jgi:hypothetical protein